MSNSEITASGDPLFAEEQAFLVYASRCLREMKKARKDLSSAAANREASGLLWKMSEEQREALSHPRSLAIGRIDLADGENWHIGPRVLWDGAKAVVIYWATQAAEPYYEATTESPMGLQQRVTLRSEFDVLRGIRREILGTGRGTEAEPVFDDMLLAELSRHRTGAMSEVAATIKRDQYRIIKAPADRPMVVQGGPGTGKTVVGLHRAAFILYRSREREEATSSSLLIVGPTPSS
jgi:DNA helicase IV